MRPSRHRRDSGSDQSEQDPPPQHCEAGRLSSSESTAGAFSSVIKGRAALAVSVVVSPDMRSMLRLRARVGSVTP